MNANGGRITAQLWHCGRISHSAFFPEGEQPIAPFALAAVGQAWTMEGPKDLETPRALETDEVAQVVEQFAHGASRVAVLDGVAHQVAGDVVEPDRVGTDGDLGQVELEGHRTADFRRLFPGVLVKLLQHHRLGAEGGVAQLREREDVADEHLELAECAGAESHHLGCGLHLAAFELFGRDAQQCRGADERAAQVVGGAVGKGAQLLVGLRQLGDGPLQARLVLLLGPREPVALDEGGAGRQENGASSSQICASYPPGRLAMPTMPLSLPSA